MIRQMFPLLFVVLLSIPALGQESPPKEAENGEESQEPAYPLPTLEEADRIRELLSKLPMPKKVKDYLDLLEEEKPEPEPKKTEPEKEPKRIPHDKLPTPGKAGQDDYVPSFSEDPAYHIGKTDAEREAIRKKLNAMPPEEALKFIEDEKKKYDERTGTKKDKTDRKSKHDDEFVSEGVLPKDTDMTQEEFLAKLEKAKAEREAKIKQKITGKKSYLEFLKARSAIVLELRKFGQKATPFIAGAFLKADTDTGIVLVDILSFIRDDPRANSQVLTWAKKLDLRKPLLNDEPLMKLARLGIPGMIDVFKEKLRISHYKNRVSLLRAVYLTKTPENIETVAQTYLDFLQQGDLLNNEVALNFLAMLLPDPDLFDTVKQTLMMRMAQFVRDRRYKNAAPGIASAIARSRHPDSLAYLRDFLRLRDGRVVLQSIRGIAFFGNKAADAVPDLVDFLSTSMPAVIRMETAKALGAIGDERAIWPLIDVLYQAEASLQLKRQASGSLQRITKKNFGLNGPRWNNWWQAELLKRERGG